MVSAVLYVEWDIQSCSQHFVNMLLWVNELMLLLPRGLDMADNVLPELRQVTPD